MLKFKIVVLGIILFFAGLGLKAQTAKAPVKTPLKRAKEIIIKRYLLPMPQELRMGKSLYITSPENVSIIGDESASEEVRRILKTFKTNWQKKYKTTLTEKNGGLKIVVGLVNEPGLLQNAVKKGIINKRYLRERPNREQAYAISTVDKGNQVTVYLAANAPVGIHYGLLTIERLLKGASGKGKIAFPQCDIVDWPDLKERGLYAVRFFSDKALKTYSGMKLNSTADWVWPKVSKDGKIITQINSKLFTAPKKYFIMQIPIQIHYDYLIKPNSTFLKYLPEVVAKGKLVKKDVVAEGNGIGRTFCYSNPKTQDVIDQMLINIVKAGFGNRVDVWLSEGKNRCYCEKCGGDLRKQTIMEVKHVVHAYKRVLKINPKLQMILCLTQGTYNNDYELLKYVPKDVLVDVYAGSGPSNTYNQNIKEYALTPMAEGIVSKGYPTGAVITPVQMRFLLPDYMPQFIKLRMSELKNRGIIRFYGWFIAPFKRELALEACADFSWNVDGRNAREFIASWAQRRGMKEPDQVAAIVRMLEYPIRALGNTSWRGIQRIADQLNGKKTYWSDFHDPLHNSFEFQTQFSSKIRGHEELKRVLKVCEKAVEESRKLQNQELLSAALLVKQFVEIIERYSYFLSHDNPETRAKVKQEVFKLSAKLPELWKAYWVDMKKFENTSKNKASLNKMLQEFQKLSTQKNKVKSEPVPEK